MQAWFVNIYTGILFVFSSSIAPGENSKGEKSNGFSTSPGPTVPSLSIKTASMSDVVIYLYPPCMLVPLSKYIMTGAYNQDIPKNRLIEIAKKYTLIRNRV